MCVYSKVCPIMLVLEVVEDLGGEVVVVGSVGKYVRMGGGRGDEIGESGE